MNSINQPDQKSVSEYYDNLWKEIDSGNRERINNRHRYILNYLIRSGLKNDSKVVEVGCGNGVITELIASKIKDGKITGIDIVEKTISNLRSRHNNSKVMEFLCLDFRNFQPDFKYDFIIFPDVLEHIPVEMHLDFLKKASEILTENGVMIINIPNPRATAFFKKHNPELLQIIDQELHSDFMLNNCYKSGFYAEYIANYSIFCDIPDYQIYVLKKEKPYDKMPIRNKWLIKLDEILLRLKNW